MTQDKMTKMDYAFSAVVGSLLLATISIVGALLYINYQAFLLAVGLVIAGSLASLLIGIIVFHLFIKRK